ncbi:MAG: glycoside hydrolase family 5 protein [Lentisphaeraceae bacterium]|nr:glycoside hydrolase family 5 protein [Lentisphaeraceae bacterium]
MRVSSFIFCLFFLFQSLTAENLIKNGDFQAVSENGETSHWSKLPSHASIEQEKENKFLRLVQNKPGNFTMLYKLLFLNPKDAGKEFQISYRYRIQNLVKGEKPWNDARVLIKLKDEAGKEVGKVKPLYYPSNNSKWQSASLRFQVPEGVTQIEVLPTLFQVKSGSMDLDNLSLKVYTPSRAETVKFPLMGDKDYPKELRTDGNVLKNTANESVWLQGLSIPSLEWSDKGDYIHNSVVIGIEEWNANAIRLPVSDKFWFGQKGKDKTGETYRKLVDDLIEASATRGAYVILDLHTYRAAKQSTIDFWVNAAERYKNHPAVLFGLLNEPHGIDWEVWRNGGEVSSGKKKANEIAENKEKHGTFKSPGMQAVLEAVRETGAKNICVVGGLGWSYSLAGILKGFALEDKVGNGIMYDTHVYPWKRGWQKNFLDVAAKHPILVGENGCEPEPLPFLPKSAHEDPHTWAPDMLACIQKYKLNWTAWSFHPKASPRVLNDWNYSPTSFWGKYVFDALHGKQFKLTRLR